MFFCYAFGEVSQRVVGNNLVLIEDVLDLATSGRLT